MQNNLQDAKKQPLHCLYANNGTVIKDFAIVDEINAMNMSQMEDGHKFSFKVLSLRLFFNG